jgi:glycerol-3-phosphate dehydrogenase (NAD(P)+)
VVTAINETHRHPKYLRDIVIHNDVRATGDIERALARAGFVVMATPSHAMRESAVAVKPYVRDDAIVVSLAKGVECETLKRMSEVLSEEMPPKVAVHIGVLSGPNHAEEVSKNIPSATVVSSRSRGVAAEMQDVFMTPFFRVYTNPDLVGVEISAAVKNVIAIAAGISDGLGYGDNTKASLLTRGLAEIARLGGKMGADVRTFAGLAGIGDLVVTCMSKHSRNRAVGEMIGKGMTPEQANAEMTMVAEGVRTAKAIVKLAERCQIHMPISENVHDVLYNSKNPFACVSELMSRGAIEEVHGLAWEID